MPITDAPGLCRIYRRLLTVGPSTAYELAEACFVVRRHAQWSLNRLHEVGLAHIVSWRKQFGTGARGRPYSAVWVYGPGKHAERPAPESPASTQRRRAQRLVSHHGVEIASRILYSRKNGGADRIVQDGVTIYQRASPRGKRVA